MTKIEEGYVAQGFTLPAGWTWARVAERRARYGVGAIYVPVANGHGCVAWGVPMIDGEFLTHDDSPRDLG
jgi:hypothetical protein